MIRKFYDTEIGGNGGGYGDPVVNEESFGDTFFMECDCGTHILKIESHKDIYTLESGKKQVHQDIYFAMYNSGAGGKDGFWRRIRIALNYLKTGKMFSDQLVLNPDEAIKAADFIKSAIVPTEIPNDKRSVARNDAKSNEDGSIKKESERG